MNQPKINQRNGVRTAIEGTPPVGGEATAGKKEGPLKLGNPDFDAMTREAGRQSEGTHQRQPRGGGQTIAQVRTFTASGSPAERANAYVRSLEALAERVGSLSEADVIEGLSQAPVDGDALSFLWTPEGEGFRMRLNQAFDRLAGAFPEARIPGRAMPIEVERLEAKSADELKADLESTVAHWKDSLDYLPYEPRDLEGLDRSALIDEHINALTALRTYPLGFLNAIQPIHEAQARGASAGVVARHAQAVLDRYGDQQIALIPWLQNLAAGDKG